MRLGVERFLSTWEYLESEGKSWNIWETLGVLKRFGDLRELCSALESLLECWSTLGFFGEFLRTLQSF